MSRHRAEPVRRRGAPAPHRHAASAPRYGRIGVLAVAVFVCAVALLGGTGVLPSISADSEETVARDLTGTSANALVLDSAASEPPAPTASKQPKVKATTEAAKAAGNATSATSAESDRVEPDASTDESLPADSGQGYRVVFSEDRQRVWLVGADGTVERTYPVSGSIYDNLDPGTYQVYSRSEQAYAFDGSGSMKYFVRFTQGNNAAIGFHDVPLDNQGNLVQRLDQLGTPLSHGCIRQEREDAVALWEFAPIGTTVVVV